MPINPLTGLEEDDLSDIVGKYENDRQQIIGDQASYDTTGAIAGALASLGAGFQGKDSMSAVNQIQNQRRQAKQDELSALDKWRQGKIQEIQLKREGVKNQREDAKYDQDQDLLARERDPNSQESKMANELAVSMGYKGAPVTAEQFKQFSPVMQKRYEIEQRKLDRGETRALRNDLNKQKLDEKEQGLKTPFGLANTQDDAKNLKSAFESKQNFDNKINEMIKLREKHGGGAILNRDDVERGKQLSKDLLLEYKNMAKLGVLSQSDENIINAIIPADPLQFNSPLAAIQGQDPTLHRLKSFKEDSDKDFKTRVATRTRSGVEGAADRPSKIASTDQSFGSEDAEAVSQARQRRIAELKAKQRGGIAKGGADGAF